MNSKTAPAIFWCIRAAGQSPPGRCLSGTRMSRCRSNRPAPAPSEDRGGFCVLSPAWLQPRRPRQSASPRASQAGKEFKYSPPLSAKAKGSNQGRDVCSSTWRLKIKIVAGAFQQGDRTGGTADILHGGRIGWSAILFETGSIQRTTSSAGLALHRQEFIQPARAGPFIIVDHGDKGCFAVAQGLFDQDIAHLGDAAFFGDHTCQRPAISRRP